MANTTLESSLKALQKALQKKPDTSTSTYDPAKQVEGYKKRLEASGIDPEQALDKRNFLEKALNLTPEQNTLFDIFEIINRPQQALFGGINAAQMGTSMLEGAKQGITGNKEVWGKDLLHNMGVADSKKSVGFDDIAGLAADIFLDPVNLPAIPLKGAVSVITKADDVLDLAKTALKAANVSQDATKIAHAERMVSAAKTAADAARKVKLHTPLQAASRATKGALTGSLKLADKGITAALKSVDAKTLSRLEDLAQLPTHLSAVAKYKDAKQYIQGLFDVGKRLPKDVWNKIFKIRGAESISAAELSVLNKDIQSAIDNVAIKKGVDPSWLGTQVQDWIETFKYNPKLKWFDALQNPKQVIGADSWQTVSKIISESGLKPENIYEFAADLGDNGVYIVKNIKQHQELVDYLIKNEKTLYTKGGANTITDVRQAQREKIRTFMAALPDEKRPSKDTIKRILARFDAGASVDEVFDKLPSLKAKGITDGAMATWRKKLRQVETDVAEHTKLFGEELAPRIRTPEHLDELKAFYADPEFKAITDQAFATIDIMEETLDDAAAVLVGEGQGASTKFATAIPEGTVHHAATKDYKTIQESAKPWPDYQEGASLRGSRNTFTGREYRLGAKEANELARRQMDILLENGQLKDKSIEFWQQKKNFSMFEEELQKSFDEFINEGPRLLEQVKAADEILAKGFLLDNDLIRRWDNFSGSTVPKGYLKIEKSALLRDLKALEFYLDDGTALEKAREMLRDSEAFNTKTLLVEKNIWSTIGRMKNPKDSLDPIIEGVDAWNSLFKKTKLLSPGFQIRNFLGNGFNIWAAGLNTKSIVRNFKRANNVLSKGDDVLAKVVRGQSLNDAEKIVWQWYEPFIKNNFHKAAKDIWDAGKIEGDNVVKKAAKWITEKNGNANEYIDHHFRLALFMFASENPSILSKLEVADPAQAVRKVLFDPMDLSYAERETAKRLIPFYTFTKKNLAYQFDNLFRNTKKYKDMKKALDDMWKFNDLTTDDIEQYKREDFWIPIPFLDKDGNYSAIRAKLPIEDLGELIDNPLRKFVAAATPAIRAPFELTANKQLFTQMPIEEFKGQEGYMIPEIGRKPEYILSQTGLDVPIGFAMDIGRSIAKGAKGELKDLTGLQKVQQGFGRSFLSVGNAEKARTSKAYQELNQVRELMQYYKQEDIDVLTLAEAENRNRTFEALLAKLKSLS